VGGRVSLPRLYSRPGGHNLPTQGRETRLQLPLLYPLDSQTEIPNHRSLRPLHSNLRPLNPPYTNRSKSQRRM